MIKLAFIYGKKPSSIITKLFTGSTCYHVGFTDGKYFWDMNLIRRRRNWPLYPTDKVILANCPSFVTKKYLEHKLTTDDNRYGVLDYLLLALRPIYHLFGLSTRNAGGKICSEMVWDDLNACGWTWQYFEVPSPATLEDCILGDIDAISKQ